MVPVEIRRIVSLGLLLAALAEATTYPHILIRPPTAFAAHYASLHLNKSLQRAAPLDMAKSPDVSLRHDILNGATMKLIQKRNTNVKSETLSDELLARYDSSHIQQVDVAQKNNFTYFVRQACRSEIDQITDVLMKAFHPQSQPMFDSYIRKYKYNHLQMCFDAIPECERALFVACAVSSHQNIHKYPTVNAPRNGEETIIGFCCVDGRPPDPSSKLEFLTASTLATTCPRPYLADLGVLPAHRRNGLGRLLVRACEEWAFSRGYDTMYLKADEKNTNGMNLYKIMGYKKSFLPGVRGSNSKKWGTDILLEKKLGEAEEPRRTKTWMKRLLTRSRSESLLAEDGR
ncbi:hypothetical protein ACHAW6_008489 [Cyclotella cf. meneghiniana]